MISQMRLTSSDISANAPTTKTSTRPPLYLMSAVAIGPSEPGGSFYIYTFLRSKNPGATRRTAADWARRLLLDCTRDLITHGADSAAMLTAEDGWSGHFLFDHPEKGGYSAA